MADRRGILERGLGDGELLEEREAQLGIAVAIERAAHVVGRVLGRAAAQRARRRLAQALDGPAVRQSREQQLRGDAVEIGAVLGELPRGAAVQVGAHGRRDIAVDRGAHDRVHERQALDALGDRRAGERAGRGRGRGRLEPRQASRLAERRAVAEDRERAGELGRAGAQRDQPAQQQPRDALGSELADVGAGPALGELARQRVQVVRVAARGVETLAGRARGQASCRAARRSARRRRPG